MKIEKTRKITEISHRKSTLKDVAEFTGYSINTVSRALRNLPDISPKTREVISEVALGMGYVPDMVASAMRSGRTRTVAIIIPDIVDPLFAIWAKHIETNLRKCDFNALILNTDENYVKEEYAIKFALSKKVEGIVLCPVQKDSKDIQLLKRINLPFVLIGRHFNTIETDYVIMDDSNGAFLATQYLIDMGRKSILYLNAHNYISSAVERKSGYQHALEKNNIDYNPELVREIDIVKNGDCHRVLKELKMENIHFDAVLSFSDLIAWQMIYFLNKEKITIPGDVAVIGFDNLQSSIYYPYSLTSVTYSKKKVADEVVRILMQKMEDNTWSKFEQIVIGTSLFIGEST